MDLIDRLALLPSLQGVPREQLEWLVTHGEIIRFDTGSVMFSPTHPQEGLLVVLSGRFSVLVERAGVSRVVRNIESGSLSGYLPYSRMTAPPGNVVADEPVELLLVRTEHVRQMTAECYELTAQCVHEMIDRARAFKSDDLHQEKMASLGRLSAGLAHELNNPSSAIERSARSMDTCQLELVGASRAVGELRLDAPQLDALGRLEVVAARDPGSSLSSVERGDREDRIEQWLADHALACDAAEPLAGTAVEPADLDCVASVLTSGQLATAMRYIAATVMARQLTQEIENAALRIHVLVAAVKKHTHMDRAPIVEAIYLSDHLADALTLVGAKARTKRVAVELIVDPNLPPVQGIVGELNEVWLNLLDNAVDAVSEGGHICVSARREHDAVVVRVSDDGVGIPEADQARVFEPFFTTKPVGQGAGLGLDVVQGVVRSHGGSVDLRSEPGRTEFRVALPFGMR